MRRVQKFILPGLAVVLLAAGCRGLATDGEKVARRDLAEVGGRMLTNAPVLTTNSTLNEAVYFAAQNNPQVRVAYADWAAAVENITIARSLPDPKLTFQAYIQDELTSLMPGFTADIPGPGKLSARAAAASAESRAKYFEFAAAVQEAAYGVEKSYYPLHFLDAKLAVNRQMLTLLAEREAVAQGQNETGQATLQEVLKARVEREQLQNEITNLEDSRAVMEAEFKAALGLGPDQAEPPVPVEADFSDGNGDDGAFLASGLKDNPRLQEMAVEIQAAEANIKVARREKIPDFSAGLQAEVYEPPFYWPQASMTLPIWRDKLAAERAAAEAGVRAANATLNAGQISLAVEYAGQAYLMREADRELALLRGEVLPRAQQSLEIARAGYRAGGVDFSSVIEAERSLLDFQLAEIAMQTQRAVARAELVLLVAGVPPERAPLLKNKKADSDR